METVRTLTVKTLLVKILPVKIPTTTSGPTAARIRYAGTGFSVILTLLLSGLMSPATSAARTLHLPDGALGKPGLQLWGYRTNITLDASDPRGADGAEFSSGRAAVLIPVSRRVTLFARYQAENRLNILHQAQVGFKFRIFQPDTGVKPLGGLNPDGPVGYPYFSISGGFRLYESRGDTRFGIVGVGVTYPLSRTLTISAGAEFNTDTSTTIVNRFFGSLSVYTSHYLPAEPYTNPDGPVGYLNFRLSGGGSGEGLFGQLDILFPLNDQVTIGGFVRNERVAFPYERSASLGARFQLYPGVIR